MGYFTGGVICVTTDGMLSVTDGVRCITAGVISVATDGVSVIATMISAPIGGLSPLSPLMGYSSQLVSLV